MQRINGAMYMVILWVGILLYGFTSCTSKSTGKELVDFVKDEANGYNQSFRTRYGSEWKILMAPKEYMALNSLKKSVPPKEEYEDALAAYSDMMYVILETKNEDRIPSMFCEQSFFIGCGKLEHKSLMCQEINSLKGENIKEYMLAFPKEVWDCSSSICIYLRLPDQNTYEEIGCLSIANMKTLPAIKTN